MLTNRHVLADKEYEKISISAVFNYEGTEKAVEFPLLPVPLLCSNEVANLREGSRPNLGLEQLDFVMLQWEVPACPAKREDLSKLTECFLTWEESDRTQKVTIGTPLAIIGHPNGGPKHGSFATLIEEFDAKAKLCFMSYTRPSTMGGSSGSPVFPLVPPLLLGKSPTALHFASGLGVTFIGGIAESMRNAIAAYEKTKMSEKDFEEWEYRNQYR